MKQTQTTRNKALEINRDYSFYGSFAEIGAGQEVARHFFQAGLASNTVAKSMSAYDKAFSDSIYGKGSRFVSEERLMNMLKHEYELLDERLPHRREETCFFAFANTVATSSHQDVPTCHGWMGIRFQKRPGGPFNDMVIHVRMLDRLRLQQQEALGILGVNLIYAAAAHLNKPYSELVASLIDNLSTDRIEINYVRLSGPDVEHFDNRLLSLELVKQNITRAVLFGPKGEPISTDALYKKPVLVLRGRFRPVTLVNVTILESALRQMEEDLSLSRKEIMVMTEMTMSNLIEDGQVDHQDFLDRVDTLCFLGHHVLVSNYPLFSQLHKELRRLTDNFIVSAMGATTLPALFEKKHYSNYPGGILGAFGDLFDDHTRIYVFPYKTDKACVTTATYSPSPDVKNLVQYLIENRFIIDIQKCDEVDMSYSSEAVRDLLAKNDPKWEKLVPTSVRDLIKKKKLFGYSR